MRFLPAFAIATLALVAGCSGSANGNDDRNGNDGPSATAVLDLEYDVCGAQMTGRDVAKVIDGNLVVVGNYREQGRTGGEMAVGMALQFALNGIDFGDPSPKYKFEHGNGEYSYKNGEAGWTIALTWAKDFETHHAGEPIAEDLFSVDTYAKNIHFDFTAARVRWDAGPLASLVDGDIDVEPSSLRATARLRGDLIALELKSVGIFRGIAPYSADIFKWHISTLRSTVAEIANQAKSGVGFGLTFADSTYRSPFFGVEEDFADGRVMVIKDAAGALHLEGPYDATLRTGGRTLYQRGFVTTRAANKTEYFCDAGRTKRLGVANHSLDLRSGTFVLDASGTKIPYGLSDF